RSRGSTVATVATVAAGSGGAAGSGAAAAPTRSRGAAGSGGAARAAGRSAGRAAAATRTGALTGGPAGDHQETDRDQPSAPHGPDATTHVKRQASQIRAELRRNHCFAAEPRSGIVGFFVLLSPRF